MWEINARSCASCGLFEANIANPTCLHAITSEWSPKMLNACVAIVLAVTWNTHGNNSPAILYMLGIINNNPWLAVKVLVILPVAKLPCTAPAAPFSDCISATLTFEPKILSLPTVACSSIYSAIAEDGVIGKIRANSLNA